MKILDIKIYEGREFLDSNRRVLGLLRSLSEGLGRLEVLSACFGPCTGLELGLRLGNTGFI